LISEFIIENRELLAWQIKLIWLFIPILFTAIVLHEFGHWVCMKKFKPDIKIHFSSKGLMVGEEEDYNNLKPQELEGVYMFGILFGLAFIILYGIVIDVTILILLLPYLMGCKKDIKNWVKYQSISEETK
jgi:hypothetical protein